MARSMYQRQSCCRNSFSIGTSSSGLADGSGIPIETRDTNEVLTVAGRDDYGQTVRVAIAPHGTKAVNYAFDVTPARLVTGLITERGITRASKQWMAAMFPDRAKGTP